MESIISGEHPFGCGRHKQKLTGIFCRDHFHADLKVFSTFVNRGSLKKCTI